MVASACRTCFTRHPFRFKEVQSHTIIMDSVHVRSQTINAVSCCKL